MKFRSNYVYSAAQVLLLVGYTYLSKIAAKVIVLCGNYTDKEYETFRVTCLKHYNNPCCALVLPLG